MAGSLKALQAQLEGGLGDGSGSSQPVEQRRVEFHRATRPETSYNVQKPKAQKNGAGGGSGGATPAVLNDDVLVLPMGRQIIYPEGKLERLCVWADQKPIGRGLSNLGNTCYLNSVLQCLAYSPPFAQYMIKAEPSKKCERVPGCCFVKLLEEHLRNVHSRAGGKQKPPPHQQKFGGKHQRGGNWAGGGGGGGGALAPTHIVKNLRVVGKHFRVGRQEDAHEFLCHLLQAVQKRMLRGASVSETGSGRRPETTALHRIYGGYLRSQIKCPNTKTCGRASSTYDAFLDLSLEMRKSTSSIKSALATFTKVETLDRDNRWRCPGCNKLVCAEKRFSIHVAPPMLVIHLKRFAWGFRAGGKLMKHISFAEKLDLHRFSSEAGDPAAVPGARKNDGGWGYSLAGVVVHHGSGMGGGHYTAYVKSSAGTWYHMDDSSVRQVTLQHVLEQQAYLVFYVKTSTAAKVAMVKAKAATAATQVVGEVAPQQQQQQQQQQQLQQGQAGEPRGHADPRPMMGPVPPPPATAAAVAVAVAASAGADFAAANAANAAAVAAASNRSMAAQDVAARARRMMRAPWCSLVPVVAGTVGINMQRAHAARFMLSSGAAVAVAGAKERKQAAAKLAAAQAKAKAMAPAAAAAAAAAAAMGNGAATGTGNGAANGRGVAAKPPKQIIRKDQDARVVSVGLTKAGGKKRGFGWKASTGGGAGLFDGGGVTQWGDEEKQAAAAAAVAAATELAQQRVRGPDGEWLVVNPGAAKGVGAAAAAAGAAAASSAGGVDPEAQKQHNRLLRQARKDDAKKLKKRTQDEWDLSLDRGRTKKVKKDKGEWDVPVRFEKKNNRFAVAQVQAAEWTQQKKKHALLYDGKGPSEADHTRADEPGPVAINEAGDDKRDW